jgi:hypothetical protein
VMSPSKGEGEEKSSFCEMMSKLPAIFSITMHSPHTQDWNVKTKRPKSQRVNGLKTFNDWPK